MFNALKYTDILESSGFTKEQAQTSLKVLSEIMEKNFATNDNLKMSELEIRGDMHRMESGIRSDMQKMESGIRSDMQKMESGIRADMQKMETGIRSDMQKMESGIRSDMQNMETGIRADMKKMETEIRSDIQIIRSDIVHLDQKISVMGDKLTIRLTGVMVVVMGLYSGLFAMLR